MEGEGRTAEGKQAEVRGMTDDPLAQLAANLSAHRAVEPCAFCGSWPGRRHERTCPKAKRGRNNRKRGGSWELEAARLLANAWPDARKTGPLGGPDDIIAGPLFVQAKAVASLYPKALDRLLADIEAHCTADQVPLVVLKHPGHERFRKLVVLDARDFINLVLREREP